MKSHKSQFKSEAIRELNQEESLILKKVEAVISGASNEEIIGKVPDFVSQDGKVRPLVFSHRIAKKISEHGDFIRENLVINAVDWDYVLRNPGGRKDKINLIKSLPDGGFIRIGANKDNGYFVVTHYQNIVGKSQKLKNLLGKGDALDRFGRTPLLT